MIKDILKKKIKIKNKAFTLAEILVTLTIIGIIAAILFPSILANYTERTLNAKRQALVARMSQAMAELADDFANYEDAEDPINNSALKFINEGLSKVYKISAACDYATLKSCDIPETVTRLDGTTFDLIANSKRTYDYSQVLYSLSTNEAYRDQHSWVYNTSAPAGFMTKNGESILLFFNPRCRAKATGSGSTTLYYSSYVSTACVNMVYDLNGGKQKPNRLNEDIGFMTVFYSDAPYVASPKILAPSDMIITGGTGTTTPTYSFNNVVYDEAKAACAALGDNARVSGHEDTGSIALNMSLYKDPEILDTFTNGHVSNAKQNAYYWTSKQIMDNGTLYNVVLEINYSNNGMDNNLDIPDALHPYICIQD